MNRIITTRMKGIFFLFFSLTSLAYQLNAYENFGTTVTRCPDGCTIHITIQIGVVGTDAEVASLTTTLENCWEGKDCFIKCVNPPKKCRVTVDVVVVKWSNLSDDDKKKFHQVTMVDGNKPSSAYMGTPNGNNGSATLRRDGAYVNEYCHEVGHLGGLKDSYCGKQATNYATPFVDASCAPGTPNPCDCVPPDSGRCTKPCDGFANDLMNSLQNVTCTEILGIVSAAGMNSCPENPCCLLSETIYVPDTYDPCDGCRPSTTTPNFRWIPTSHAINYEIELYDPLGIKRWGQTIMGPAPVPECRIPHGILEFNERYSWHVRATYPRWYYENGEGTGNTTSDWSELSYFTPVHTYYVNTHEGNNDYDGLTPHPTPDGHGPKKTINGAVGLNPNEKYQIVVLQGEYVESVEIQGPVDIDCVGEVSLKANSPAIISSSPQQVSISNMTIIAPAGSEFALINGSGNVICTDCIFISELGPLSFCLDVYAKTQDGHIPGFGPGKLFFNHPRCAPFDADLDLWLDPTGLNYETGAQVSLWPDNTKQNPLSYIPGWENAAMTDEKKQPSYFTDALNKFPGVRFITDYAETKYGYSDIMEIPYSKYITSENTDQWNPERQDKSLLVVFKTGDYINPEGGVDPVYYSNGRQTIFETGGPLTGMNIYILNGKICFGMWNRFERRYTIYDPPLAPDFYPLDPDELYMAHIEYNSAEGVEKFRAIISNSVETAASPDFPGFIGLTRDGDDKSAVGGAARTSYHDYNTGETYSDHFGGIIGDVMLYNKFFSSPEAQMIYTFLSDRYNTPWVYPGGFVPKEGDWRIYETDEFIETHISTAYPNPFTSTTSFGVSIDIPSRVVIELFDKFGRVKETLFNGELNKGIHNFFIRATDLPNGMYNYRVNINGSIHNGSVILIR